MYIDYLYLTSVLSKWAQLQKEKNTRDKLFSLSTCWINDVVNEILWFFEV